MRSTGHLPMSTRVERQEVLVGTAAHRKPSKVGSPYSVPADSGHLLECAWSCQIHPEKPERQGRENSTIFFFLFFLGFEGVSIRKLLRGQMQPLGNKFAVSAWGCMTTFHMLSSCASPEWLSRGQQLDPAFPLGQEQGKAPSPT